MALQKGPLIYVVDDLMDQRRLCLLALKPEGFRCLEFSSAEEALGALNNPDIENPDALLLDVALPGMSGLELLEILNDKRPEIPVVIMTVKDSAEVAVQAVRLGASDFVSKPFEPARLPVSIQNAIEKSKLKKEITELKNEENKNAEIIGQSDSMLRLFKVMNKAAGSDINALITGESGTGKELIAQKIHENSARSKKPMVAVNCGAIPENLVESVLFGHEKGAFTGATEKRQGKFQEAHGGTLFLDEVGELKLDVQVKLLRALQEKEVEPVGSNKPEPVNIRLVCATHRDLAQMVDEGTFREDLFYRVNVFPMHIPPLRERKEDTPLLIKHFIKKTCENEKMPVKRIGLHTLRRLEDFPWPGNVRQLENAVYRAVILSDTQTLELGDFPLNLGTVGTTKQDNVIGYDQHTNIDEMPTLAEVEETHIRQVIDKSNGNMALASRVLGIGRSTLYRRAKEIGIL